MLYALSFHTDILLVRVPSIGFFLPEFSQRPWELVASAHLLCGAGWYLRLVCSSRTFSDWIHGKHENRLCQIISGLSSGTVGWTCPHARFRHCIGSCILHVHIHGSETSPSVQPCTGHHLFLSDLLCDLGNIHSNLHKLDWKIQVHCLCFFHPDKQLWTSGSLLLSKMLPPVEKAWAQCTRVLL